MERIKSLFSFLNKKESSVSEDQKPTKEVTSNQESVDSAYEEHSKPIDFGELKVGDIINLSGVEGHRSWTTTKDRNGNVTSRRFGPKTKY